MTAIPRRPRTPPRRQPSDWAQDVEQLVGHLSSWIGRSVEVEEKVTRLPGSYDRHVATSCNFTLRLEDVGVAISGLSLTLGGKAGDATAHYQITVERLESLTVEPREVVILERFGTVVERLSVLRLAEPG